MGRGNQWKKTSDLDADKLRNLYEAHTDLEISAMFSVTEEAIRYLRRKWRIESVNARQRREKAEGRVLSLDNLTPVVLTDLYSQISDRQIAVRYGVTKPTIRALRNSWDIAPISKSDRSSKVLRETPETEPMTNFQAPVQIFTESRVSLCKNCGALALKEGLCAECRKPVLTAICKGCGIKFQPSRRDNLFHDEACNARWKRAEMRKENPVKATREFTCKLCGSTWETAELGNFTTCPKCKEAKDVKGHTKVCGYRHCGESFVDGSPKNSMKFCCEEHRRREKLFRSGLAKDESYFRSEKEKGIHKCHICGEAFKNIAGEKNNRCGKCREEARQKVCQKCGVAFRDGSDLNTRKFCEECSPAPVVLKFEVSEAEAPLAVGIEAGASTQQAPQPPQDLESLFWEI